MNLLFHCWDPPLGDAAKHPSFRQMVRPFRSIEDPARYVELGLLNWEEDGDPLNAVWLPQNAAVDNEPRGVPFVLDDEAWWERWRDGVLRNIEKQAGGKPLGLIFDIESLWPPKKHFASRESREELLARLFYHPIEEWYGDQKHLSGNYGGYHTPGIWDQPVFYRPYDHDRCLGISGPTGVRRELRGGVGVLPWIHLIGNVQRGGPRKVSEADFMFLLGLLVTHYNVETFCLWNSNTNSGHPEFGVAGDRTRHWNWVADICPRPRDDRFVFQKMLERLNDPNLSFQERLELLSNWKTIYE